LEHDRAIDSLYNYIPPPFRNPWCFTLARKIMEACYHGNK